MKAKDKKSVKKSTVKKSDKPVSQKYNSPSKYLKKMDKLFNSKSTIKPSDKKNKSGIKEKSKRENVVINVKGNVGLSKTKEITKKFNKSIK